MLPPTIIVTDIIINTLLIMMKISKEEILDMCLLRLTLPQSPQVSSTQVAQFVRQCGFCHLYNALCGLQSGDVFKCNPSLSLPRVSTQVAQFVFHLYQNIALMHCVKRHRSLK